MGKNKPPRPPLCLCRGWVNWLFGIVSPSKYSGYIGKNERQQRKIDKYKAACGEFFEALEGGEE